MIEYLPRAVAVEKEWRLERREVEPRLMTVQPDALIEQEVRSNSAFTPAWLDETIAWLRPEDLDNPNRLIYTEDYTQSAWVGSFSPTLSHDRVDKDGGTAAVSITATSANSRLYQDATGFQSASEDSFSVWVKAGPGHNGTSLAKVRIYDGVSFTDDNFVPSASWERRSVTRTLDVGSAQCRCEIHPDQTTGSQEILVCFPQVESGSSPSAYVANSSTAGGIVSTWGDFTQGSQASMPLVVANALDGNSAALFDGVDDFMYYLTSGTGDDYEIVGSFEIHYVLRENAPAVNYILFGGDAATERPVFISTAGAVWTHTADGAATLTSSGTILDDTDYLVSVSRDASNDLTCWVNGVDVTTPASATGNAWLRFLGKRNAEYFKGSLCEALLMSPAPVAANRSRVFQYLAGKYPSLGVVIP